MFTRNLFPRLCRHFHSPQDTEKSVYEAENAPNARRRTRSHQKPPFRHRSEIGSGSPTHLDATARGGPPLVPLPPDAGRPHPTAATPAARPGRPRTPSDRPRYAPGPPAGARLRGGGGCVTASESPLLDLRKRNPTSAPGTRSPAGIAWPAAGHLCNHLCNGCTIVVRRRDSALGGSFSLWFDASWRL